MRRRSWLLIAWALAIVLVVVGALHQVRGRTDPQAAPLPEIMFRPFTVTVSAAPNSNVVQGQRVFVGVQTISPRPVRTIELWEGAVRLQSRSLAEADAVDGTAGATFVVPAGKPGTHLLYVRAVNDQAQVALSATASLAVVVGPTDPVISDVPAGQAIDLAGSGTGGTSFYDLPAVFAALGQGGAGAGAPDTAQETADQAQEQGVELEGNETTATPATATPVGPTGPAPDVRVEGCDVRIGGASGTLAHVGANSSGFTKVGELTQAGRRVTRLTPGRHVFVVAGPGGAVSAPTSVTVPMNCGLRDWKGDVAIFDGHLVLPERAVTLPGRLYGYISIGGGAWQRMPADPDNYLVPSGRLADAGVAPQIRGRDVAIQLWNQLDTTATQIATGSFLFAEDGEALPLDDPVDIRLRLDKTEYEYEERVDPTTQLAVPSEGAPIYTFTWLSSSTRVKEALYQVLAMPLSPANHEMVPFGTVDLNGSKGAPTSSGGMAGSFTLHTNDLPRYAMKGTEPPGPGIVPQPRFPGGVWGSAKDAKQETRWTEGPVTYAGGDGVAMWVRAVALLSPVPGSGQPVTSMSSQVIEIAMPMRNPGTVFKIRLDPDASTLDLGNAPMLDKAGCAQVVKVPKDWEALRATALAEFDADHPSATFVSNDQRIREQRNALSFQFDVLKNSLYVNKEICPPPPKTCGFWCQAYNVLKAYGELLIHIFDVIASAYNGLKSAIVKVIAKYNPICMALPPSAQKTCETATSVVADVALSAVMTAVGLPPYLPTSAQVLATAEGDLAQLGVLLLKQLDIPCDSMRLGSAEAGGAAMLASEAGVDLPREADGSIDACLLAMRTVIKSTKTLVKAMVTSNVAGSSGLTLPSYPKGGIMGLTIIPAPYGRPQPPLVAAQFVTISAGGDLKFPAPQTTTISIEPPRPPGFYRSAPMAATVAQPGGKPCVEQGCLWRGRAMLTQLNGTPGVEAYAAIPPDVTQSVCFWGSHGRTFYSGGDKVILDEVLRERRADRTYTNCLYGRYSQGAPARPFMIDD